MINDLASLLDPVSVEDFTQARANRSGTRVPDVDDIIRPTIDVFGTTLDLTPDVCSILRLFKTSATLSVSTICETLPNHQALSLIEAVQTLDRAGIVNLKAPRRV